MSVSAEQIMTEAAVRKNRLTDNPIEPLIKVIKELLTELTPEQRVNISRRLKE